MRQSRRFPAELATPLARLCSVNPAARTAPTANNQPLKFALLQHSG
jgi:hypothetical protein